MKSVFNCKNLFIVWMSLAVCLMPLSKSFAESVGPDDDSQYSTTGPVPPPEVLERDAQKTIQLAVKAENEVVLQVPAYLWRHGCGPTALGMVIGYYDGDYWGYDDLVPGDAFTQTDAVNQSIASQADPAHPKHYEDYSLPLDGSGPVIWDKSEPPLGDEHPNDCIGDFMRTSWSREGMNYGWSKDKYMGPSFVSYVNMRNPTYDPRFEFLKTSTGTLTWDILAGQIDCGRPMVLLVDTDGDGKTDHFVTAVGYRDAPAEQYGCWDTWSSTVRWENFQPMAPGTPWGIASGWAFTMASPCPVMHLEQNNVDIPNETGSYDFGKVKVGFSSAVTFTIKSLENCYLDLTGSPPVQISGSNAGDFVVSRQPLTQIAPGEPVSFEITFAPAEQGTRTATVSIPSTDSDRDPYTFSITGDGTGSVPPPHASGKIIGWGLNGYGQAIPPPGNDYIAIAAGKHHSLGLRANGSIVAWGSNYSGECNVPLPNTGFTAVTGGGSHSLGLKANGSMVAWGWNQYGQCNVPLPNAGFIAVAAGYYHSLGLKQNGSLVAWGYNSYGQCNVPLPNTGFTAVAAGGSHSLGLKTNGSIVAWGSNFDGESTVPSPNTGFIAIAAGPSHSLGLKANGSLVAWGYNGYGQCTVPSPNTGFIAIAAGSYHSLGLKQNGSIVAWGYNSYGQCNVPSPNTGFTAVAAGGSHSLGIQKQNTPPVANAGPDQTVSAGPDCMAEVTLDGSDSNDPDGDTLTYIWKLNGQIIPSIAGDGLINMLDFAALSQQWSHDQNSPPSLADLTKAWLTTPDDPNWDPQCDIASDGAIITVNLPLGEHHIQLVVNDGMADSEPNEVIVTVLDNTPPVITLNGLSTMVLECGVDTYTEPGATALDNCDGAIPVVIAGDTVDTSTCGTYTVTYSATDSSGNSSQAIRTVIVQDTISPQITLTGSPTIILECGVDTYTEEGATASDNCAGTVSVVIAGDTVDTSTCGAYTVIYTAADPSDNSTQVTRTVIVQDTIPPEFTLSVTPTVLWPPNHQMVLITPAWTVYDNCDNSPTVSLKNITMNEGDQTNTFDPMYDNTVDDGYTISDIQTDPNGLIYLRAERSGTGSGRVYTITYQAVDAAGNTATSSATVTVPHDQSSSE